MESNNKGSEKKTLKLGIKVGIGRPSVPLKSASFSVEVRKKKRVVSDKDHDSLASEGGGWINSNESLLTRDEQISRLFAVKKAALNKEQNVSVTPLGTDMGQQGALETSVGLPIQENIDHSDEVPVVSDISSDDSVSLNSEPFALNSDSTEHGEVLVDGNESGFKVDGQLEKDIVLVDANGSSVKKQQEKHKDGKYVADKEGDKKGFYKDKPVAKVVKGVAKLEEPKAEKKSFEKKRGFEDHSFLLASTDDVDDEESSRQKIKVVKKKKVHGLQKANKLLRKVILQDGMNIAMLATRTGESIKDICRFLIKEGLSADKTVAGENLISVDDAALVVEHFGHDVKKVAKKKFMSELEAGIPIAEQKLRPPIVTVMGHVDHGKTSLLDAIRRTDIASGEHGGITQSIGAYKVLDDEGRKITFIDTPGHEAFSAMRMRGASVTDIVVLVVAGDDGVKEQTIEAINHAKVANVPMIVAVNKMDRYGADYEEVLRELLQYDVITENFGGDVMAVPVSAKTGYNLDKLKEAILLLAEVMDLKASCEGDASGTIIETRIDKGMGILATALVKSGKLKVGDVILVGRSAFGKVRVLIDSNGSNIDEAFVSDPVRIVGFTTVPTVGDAFRVVESEKFARSVINHGSNSGKDGKYANTDMSSLITGAQDGVKVEELCVIVKADTIGSKEAICESLLSSKLSASEEARVRIVYSAVGAVSASDVTLAATLHENKAVIFAFNLITDAKVVSLAKQYDVQIYTHTIIYDLIDHAKTLVRTLISPKMVENILGTAEIRAVFSSNKKGSVVGCYILSGQLKRGVSIRVVRAGKVLHSGVLKVLKRFAEDVKEVKTGFECGVFVSGTFVLEVGDLIECFVQSEEAI